MDDGDFSQMHDGDFGQRFGLPGLSAMMHSSPSASGHDGKDGSRGEQEATTTANAMISDKYSEVSSSCYSSSDADEIQAETPESLNESGLNLRRTAQDLLTRMTTRRSAGAQATMTAEEEEEDWDDMSQGRLRQNARGLLKMLGDDMSEAEAMSAVSGMSGSEVMSAISGMSGSELDMSPSKRKLFPVPEEGNRWRFVAKAKKSEGYNSKSAGRVVEGVAATDWVSQYEVTTNAEINQNSIVRLDESKKSAGSSTKEDTKVGKLNSNDYIVEASSSVKDDVKVGRLDVRDWEEGRAEESYEVAESLRKDVGGSIREEEEVEDVAEIQQKEEVLSAREAEAVEADFGVELDMLERQLAMEPNELDDAGDYSYSVLPLPPTTTPPPSDPFTEGPSNPSNDDEAPTWRKKKRTKYMLIALLLAMIAIVAPRLVLGGKRSDGGENNNKSGKAIGSDEESSEIPPNNEKEEVVSPTRSSPPTYCPASTQLFSVQSDNGISGQIWTSASMSWTVTDAGSGDEVLRCAPCPDYVESVVEPSPPPTPAPLSLEGTLALLSLEGTPAPATNLMSADPTKSPSMSPSKVKPVPVINPPSAADPTKTTSTSLSTGKPTESPISRHMQCIGPGGPQPRPVGFGEQFRFNLLGDGDAGQCVDDQGHLYERGEFDNIDTFQECAKVCVSSTPASLALSDSFRGFDFDCPSKTCYCLYEGGTLDTGNAAGFDSSSYGIGEEYSGGTGEVAEATYKVGYYGYYCGELVNMDDDGGFPTSSPTGDVLERALEEKAVATYRSISDGVSACLSDENEYVFEVRLSKTTGECCGFAPDSFSATYGNTVIKVGSNGNGERVDEKTFFAGQIGP